MTRLVRGGEEERRCSQSGLSVLGLAMMTPEAALSAYWPVLPMLLRMRSREMADSAASHAPAVEVARGASFGGGAPMTTWAKARADSAQERSEAMGDEEGSAKKLEGTRRGRQRQSRSTKRAARGLGGLGDCLGGLGIVLADWGW